MAATKTAKPAAKTAKTASNGTPRVSEGRAAVLAYLLKHGATSAKKAIERSKVWEACGVTGGVCGAMREDGLMERRDDVDDKSKHFYLTLAGVAAAKAAAKAAK